MASWDIDRRCFKRRGRPDVGLFNRNFVLCLLVQFWFMLSFMMTTPQIAQFVVAMGESTTIAGFVAGIFSIMALAFRPVSGYAADRFYRKHVLAVGYAVCIVSYFGYAISPNYIVVLIFRIAHALGLCIQTTLISVIAMDFIPEGRVAEGVGWVSIFATAGSSLGPALGVGLSDVFGHRIAFALAGAFMAITIVLLFILPIKRHAPKQGKGFSLGSFFSRRALPLALTVMTFAFCLGMTTSMLVLVGDVRGIAGIAFFFLVSSAGAALVRPFSGKIVDRKGLQAVMPITFVSESICMLLLAFAQAFPQVMIAAVFRTFGHGIAQASLQGQALKEASPEERGVTNSTFYMGIDIGQGISAIIGGAIADAFGFTAMFFAGPVVMVIGVACYLTWYHRRKREQRDAAAS